MTIHKMKLALAPFEKIASGKKIIESRLFDEKRQQIQIGDQIEFECNTDPIQIVKTSVRALYIYPDFENMFADFPPSNFGGNSKDEILNEIETFYSKSDQTKYGVLGIKIELIK